MPCYTKPLIKWVGGKTQIIDKVLAKFPKQIQSYYELFLGGGSVLFALLNEVENKNILIENEINAFDINETLIYLYKNIQTNSELLFIEIKKLVDIYESISGEIINRNPKNIEEAKTSQESYYYWIRSQYNKIKDNKSLIRSAMFVFLNKTCFRGVYRVGPNGFNVPFGHYKNPEIISKEHLQTIKNLIKNVNFYHLDFEKSFEMIKNNEEYKFQNFVYLNPPYVPITNTSFVSYSENGFSLEKHKRLFELCNNLKNTKMLMSNSDVKLVKDNFKLETYTIEIISCKRSINAKNPESKINEVLIYK